METELEKVMHMTDTTRAESNVRHTGSPSSRNNRRLDFSNKDLADDDGGGDGTVRCI